MYVRDHQRPLFHKALGVDPDWYGQTVFEKTSEITKQVFPITIDIEHPRWMKGLRGLQRASIKVASGKKRGGVAGTVERVTGMAQAAGHFASIYTIPAKKHEVPASSRMQPAY